VGFVLLFPIAAVRTFYALQLPTKVLAATLVIGIVGAAMMITVWVILRRLGRGHDAAVQMGEG